jgi:hypothetical protein
MSSAGRRPVADEESVAPVTILDGMGRVIGVVPAEEFRRVHGAPERPKPEMWRRRRERAKPSERAEDAIEHALVG